MASAARVELPEKLYFRIGEVSRLVGVKPHVIRYWEEEISGIRPHRSQSGQRLYRRSDLQRLLEVKRLLKEEHLTVRGARRRLRERNTGQLAIPLGPADAAPAARLDAVRAGLQRILALVESAGPDGG